MPLDALNRRLRRGDDAATVEIGLAFFVAIGEFGRKQVFVALVHFHRAGEVGAQIIAFGIVGADVHFLVVRVAAQFGKDRERVGRALQRPRFHRKPQKHTPDITELQHAGHLLW